MFTEKTSLIIVCTEDTKKYGSYLMQLVGLNDDDGERIVGIRDGSVEAALWTEKEYEANRPQITSVQKVLFIGNSKLLTSERSNMDHIFDQHGMHIDSLGNHASIYLKEGSMSKKEYESFLNFAAGYQKEYEDANKKIGAVNKKVVAFSLLIFGGLYGVVGSGVFNWFKKRKEINEQRYGFLTLYTYLEYLSDFIEG